MPKTYSIRFVIEDALAKAAVKRSIDGLTSIEKSAARTATALEKAFHSAGDTAANVAGQMASVQVKAASQTVKAHADAHQKIDISLQRLQMSGLNLQDKLATAADKSATSQMVSLGKLQASGLKLQDRLSASADRQTVRNIARKNREVAELSKIEDRYLMKEYKDRIAYQERLERDAEAATARREQMILRGAKVTTAAALVGLKVLNDGYAKIREDALAATDATNKLRKNLQVESTLKGAERTDNQRLQESLMFRAQTGLDESGATEFTRQYLGSVPIAFQKKNITDATSKSLMVQAGIMAARQGGDKGTRGELAGLLGQLGQVKSAEHGLAQLEAIRVALTEGRGDDTPLTRQLLDAAGSMVREGGPIPNLTEMAVLTGVTSLTNPNEAATSAKRINRFLMETQGKGAKFLKGVGITEGMGIEQKLDILKPLVDQAKFAGRDAQSFLSESVGSGNAEEIASVVAVLNNYEAFKNRLMAARRAGAQGGAVKAANERFLASVEGRTAVDENLQAAAQVTLGLQGERFKALMGEALASPEVQEGDQSIGTKLTDRFWGYLSGEFADPEKVGREQRVESVALIRLQDRARRAGVSDEELTQARMKSYQAGSANYLPEYANQVESLINAKGGGLAVDINPVMERLAKAIERNNQLMEAGNKPNGVAPVPMPVPRLKGGAVRP